MGSLGRGRRIGEGYREPGSGGCVADGASARGGRLLHLERPDPPRVGVPRARTMIHQPSGGAQGKETEDRQDARGQRRGWPSCGGPRRREPGRQGAAAPAREQGRGAPGQMPRHPDQETGKEDPPAPPHRPE
ncbi:MAG: ATP-dependent Clp protease proteolytic subunit [Planctomycetota bacterium]